MKLSCANRRGVSAILFVIIVMGSLLTGLAISNWANIQRRGAMKMGLAMKESMLAQSAFQETRFWLLTNNTCPQSFTYYIDRSTITINIDCVPFP